MESWLMFLIVYLLVNSGRADDAPVVTTAKGTIRGVRSDDGENNLFMGIPYAMVDAANPFGVSTPYPVFDDVFEANDDSSICPQIEEFNFTVVGDLDCLRLNVDRFPYYKANDERWKNSIRHNLSINPHFRKGARAPQGAGHLWSLAANAIDLLPCNPVPEEPRDVPLAEAEVKIMGFPKVIVLDEAAIAAASILPDQDLFTGSTMFLNPVSTEQVVRECGLITVD